MSLNNGFYESVINKLIDEEIHKVHKKNDKYIDRKSIDKEEGNSVLSKYMSIVINKSLQNVSGVNKLNRQVEVCNKIVNLLMEELKLDELDDFLITTSYMGATDYKAILELSRLLNTEIRISYDTQRTRLHSKSYMFNRNTGFSTAYIGSSNLSNSALTTGLEWNLKISEYTSKDMIKKFNATFESYWHDNEFYLFNKDDENDEEKLKTALNTNKIGSNNVESQFYFDVIPYSYHID